MINSKKDYKDYYKNDCKATGIDNFSFYQKTLDIRFKYYKNLRKCEYYINCKKGLFNKIIKLFLLRKHSKLCLKTGWSIPPNVFEKGLAIVHIGTIVVSPKARIGKNCRIHVCVNIGNAPSHGKDGTPIIGDNVYIGPGAKIFGPITIGNNVSIGANAVVNSSFPNGNCSIAGVPARKISDNTSKDYILNNEDRL